MKVIELVDDFGVSDVTIRRDLDALSAKGLARKVHGGATVAVDAVGAVPHSIGVIVPHPRYYFRSVVDGIRKALAGARLTVAVSEYDAARERQLASDLVAAGAQGLLLVPTPKNNWIGHLPVPAVLVERSESGAAAHGISWVRSDHEAGADMAVRHLWQLGHRKIALVSRGDTETAWSVRKGWQQAITTLRLDADAPQLSGVGSRPGPRWSTSEITGFLKRVRKSGATALLCHSDEDALVVAQQARSLGWQLPGELSIVAYDDEIAELADPPLTAVSPPKEAVGELAARTLLDLIADRSRPARRICLEPTLIVRASTTRVLAPATPS